jgi:preprotein translocase subunit SecE
MSGKKHSENVFVLILVVIIIALLIFSVDTSPLWIYQGF